MAPEGPRAGALAGLKERNEARIRLTLRDETNISMKTKPVIAEPRKRTPHGRISGAANKQLTGCLEGKSHAKKKILNMKVDP
jgi:hypothetical protein